MIKKGDENPYLYGKEPAEFIEAKIFSMPNPWGDLNDEERKEAASKTGEAAKQTFSESIERLRIIARNFNAFQLLSHFGYYDQLLLDGVKDNHGYLPVLQSSAEWLQALVLSVPIDCINSSVENQPSSEILIECNDLLHKIQRSYGLMRISQPDVNHHSALAAELTRQHTASVRNDGFSAQTKRLLGELFRPLDAEYKKREGVSLTTIGEFLWTVLTTILQRLNEDLETRRKILSCSKVSEIIEGFSKLSGQPSEQVARDMRDFSSDITLVRSAIRNWLDKRNFRFFFFKEDELRSLFPSDTKLVSIRKVLKSLSLEWSALEDRNPEFLILDNPVWKSPFVRGGNGSYFLPIPGLIQSFAVRMIETLLAEHSDLNIKYLSGIRGDYLEKRTEECIRAAFPTATVYRGLTWHDHRSGKNLENDILVLLDCHALVFECKSGKLRDRAKRGDMAQLKTDIKKLIQDASEQGQRFAAYLVAARNTVSLKDSKGVNHELDLTSLLRVTTINVTFEYLGPLTTQAELLRKTGLIRSDIIPSATMPFHDLENVLEILDRPAIAFHYLRRRAELEAATEMMADEMGYLAFYLATAFDIGETEDGGPKNMVAPNLSDQLNPYFMGKEINASVPRPKLHLRQWWSDVLQQFESRAFAGWLEASYTLLCFGPENQLHFEQSIDKLCQNLRSKDQDGENDTCIGILGRENSKTALACLIVRDFSITECRSVAQIRMDHIAGTHKASRQLVICRTLNGVPYPYLASYFHCPELDDGSLKAGNILILRSTFE